MGYDRTGEKSQGLANGPTTTFRSALSRRQTERERVQGSNVVHRPAAVTFQVPTYFIGLIEELLH